MGAARPKWRKKFSQSLKLVLRAFVEICGHTVSLREQRARFAGAHEAEALAAAGEPRLEVAAEGVGEEQPHIGGTRSGVFGNGKK